MSRRTSSRLVAAAVVVAGVALAPGVSAYLKLGSRIPTGIVQIKWAAGQMPIRYQITNRDVPGVTAVQLQAALERAFTEWASVPTATLSSQFTSFTGAEPGADDQATVIGFRSRPDLDRVLASTSFKLDQQTGAIIESDIFFNTTVNWSVAPNGESARYDVEAIAVHEVGHLLGLGHSALGETDLGSGGRIIRGKLAVMFPIAYPPGNIEDRNLKRDDAAGISDIYPTADFSNTTGAITGRVALPSGGVFGAHVTAFSLESGTMTGGYSLNAAGDFVVAGLVPGLYVVRVEPLDDADVNQFFDEDTIVSINFRPAYYERLVAVPAGGSSGAIEIRVQPK